MATVSAQSTPALFRSWSSDVIEIKQLFDSRRYRSCAGRCEELQVWAVHPIHRSFLSFYQALSYESLGTAAHICSTNKLPLLRLARDCFAVALHDLPQVSNQFSSTSIVQLSASAQFSPACITSEIADDYQDGSQGNVAVAATLSPSNSVFCHVDKVNDDDMVVDCSRSVSDSSSTEPATETDARIDSCAVGADSSTFEERMLDMEIDKSYKMQGVVASLYVTSDTTLGHKVRLSHSLSSSHSLADALVPSPLFRRTKMAQTAKKDLSAKIDTGSSFEMEDGVGPTVSPSTHSSHQPCRTQSRQRTNCEQRGGSEDRPLPPLPFNHNPHFIRHGSRHILVPATSLTPLSTHRRSGAKPCLKTRSSSIQALVTRFEDKIDHSRSASPLAVGTPIPKTPVTPRFLMIKKAFGGADEDKENIWVGEQTNTHRSIVRAVKATAEDSDRMEHHAQSLASWKGPSVRCEKLLRGSDNISTPTPTPTTSMNRYSPIKRPLLETPASQRSPARQQTFSFTQAQIKDQAQRSDSQLCAYDDTTGVFDVAKPLTTTSRSRTFLTTELESKHDRNSHHTVSLPLPVHTPTAAIRNVTTAANTVQYSATYIHALTSFRNALQDHLTSITARIETATHARSTYGEKKEKCFSAA